MPRIWQWMFMRILPRCGIFPSAIKSSVPWFRFQTISRKVRSALRRQIFQDFSILRKDLAAKFAVCIDWRCDCSLSQKRLQMFGARNVAVFLGNSAASPNICAANNPLSTISSPLSTSHGPFPFLPRLVLHSRSDPWRGDAL